MGSRHDIASASKGRAADAAVTASEREAAALGLSFEGRTDAVSAGIVFGSAEGAPGPAKATIGPVPPQPVEKARPHGLVVRAGARTGPAGVLRNGPVRAILGGAGTAAMRESDELSGEASALEAAGGTKRAGAALRRWRSAPAATTAPTEGAGSSRGPARAGRAADRMDMGLATTAPDWPRTAAETARLSGSRAKAGTIPRTALTRSAAKGLAAPAAGAAQSGTGAVAGAAGIGVAPAAAALCVLLLLSLVAASFTALADPAREAAQLGEVEGRIYSFFKDKGLGDVHIAAIMGNMKAESGMDPARIESNGVGIGICQWSYGRADALRAFAASRGKDWSDLETQLEFFWTHDEYHLDWSAAYRVSGGYADPSPPPGTLVSGSKAGFLAADTVEEATRQFCYGWERPGFPRIDGRIESALAYYDAITSSGSGERLDNASDRQKAVVDACRRTPWPGADLCARWVTNAFANAGVGAFGGNAEDQFAWWCHSSDRGELKVGMIVAVDDSPTSHWGHVGIYIGDGKVMESLRSGVVETDLDSWIAYNGRGGAEPVRWGWYGGVDLS